MKQIIRNPKTLKELAYEINAICDKYWDGKIKEEEAKEYIFYWNKELFNQKELNPTIKKIIGKRRQKLIETWINEINPIKEGKE